MKPLLITFSTLFIFSNWIIKGTESENRSLLTAGSQKIWQLIKSTPQSGFDSCQPMGSVMADNTWTFYTDGAFEFDHGTVTEDPECMYEGCCCDLVNITGTWEFTNDGIGIRIVMLHEKGNPANAFNEEWYNAQIDFLDESRFQFTEVDAGTGEEYTFEFRVREENGDQ